MTHRNTGPASDFRPADFFVVRTPLLPFASFAGSAEPLGAAAACSGGGDLKAAIARDLSTLRTALRRLLARPEVRDALYIASPDLAGTVEVWEAAPDSERGRKIERSLVKYMVRMSSRCTPFGLFAGCSVGTLSDETRLEVSAVGEHRRHTRLDADYLDLLTTALNGDPRLREECVYRPNTSLYASGQRMHCTESKMVGRVRAHSLVAVDSSPYLAAILERAAGGASIAELASEVVDDEVGYDDAKAFVEELIDSQLLVSDLHVNVTGPEPIHPLISRLNETSAGRAIGATLGSVREKLAAIDARGLSAPPEAYQDVARSLAELPVEVEITHLFQVDMVKSVRAATLGAEAVREIRRGMEWLYRLHPSAGDPLEDFREAFIERYGRDRSVPLVEVLDEEIGIGFDPEPKAQARDTHAKRTAFLLDRMMAAKAEGSRELVLGDEDLRRMATDAPVDPPAGFSVMVTLAASSPTAFQTGDFRVCFLTGSNGPSGARMFGRFCHADPVLQEHTERHLRAEEATDAEAVFAEVVHLPAGRVGNVLCRPVLREYEIPYLGLSGAEPDRQIPITDLRVSIEKGLVVLRSEKLGRRVVPRLTTAHNYFRQQLSIYRFLCQLQSQGADGAAWSWGDLSSSSHLPRVRYGRIVFSREQWRIDGRIFKELDRSNLAGRFARVQELRAELRLPRFIYAQDSATELLVDLDNVLSVEAFVELVRDRSSTTLVEMFPEPDALCAAEPKGPLTHEIVLPFEREKVSSGTSAPKRVEPASTRARFFVPGSDWLYVKLYTGPGLSDRILREVVGPVAREVVRAGAADRWFFLRYADPDTHLRVRFHGHPARLLGEVLPLLRDRVAADFDDRQIWKVQLDTYDREVERYGGVEGVRLSEEVFHIDSDAVLALLEAYPGDAGTEPRNHLAIRGIHSFFNEFGLDVEGRRRMLASVVAVDPAIRRQWSDAYRQERRIIEQLIDPAADAPAGLRDGYRILSARSARLRPVLGELTSMASAGTLHAPFEDFVLSHTHMFVNRLLRPLQATRERVFYHFLDRAYDAALARSRQVVLP